MARELSVDEQLKRRFGDFMDELEVRLKRRLASPGFKLGADPTSFDPNLDAFRTDDDLRTWLFEDAPIDDAKFVMLGFWKLVFDSGIEDDEALAIADRLLATISLRVVCRESFRYWINRDASHESP